MFLPFAHGILVRDFYFLPEGTRKSPLKIGISGLVLLQ